MQHNNLLVACVAALVVAFTAMLPQAAYASQITPPPVPQAVQVEEGNEVFLVGHAIGTQNYICLPSATATTGVAFKLFTPQATLFDDNGKQIITHFFSPNPAENGTIRVTWQDSKDTSTFRGQVKDGNASTDPDFVAKGAVAWLLVSKSKDGAQNGPMGGDTLSDTTFVQRLNTAGGLAPSEGCATLSDIGTQAFMPYTADYFFYRPSEVK
jgi:hypothetical protein